MAATTAPPKLAGLAAGHAHLLTRADAGKLRAALESDTLVGAEVVDGEAGAIVAYTDFRRGQIVNLRDQRVSHPSALRSIIQACQDAEVDVLIFPRGAVNAYALATGRETPEHEHQFTSKLDSLAKATGLVIAVESRFTPDGVLER